MAWKHLTSGDTNYYVNLDQIRYLQPHEKSTQIVLGAAGAENRIIFLNVDQSPAQILSGEKVT